MTVEQKRANVEEIIFHMERGGLTTKRLFSQFGKKTFSAQIYNNKMVSGRTGRKAKEYTDEFLTSVPLYKRTTERGYAAALKIPKTALGRLRQQGRMRTHTSTNHPALTEKHKVSRLKWVLSLINPVPAVGDPTFTVMQKWIHLDEKWFYINPETRTFYLLPTEDDPYRAQQSRRFKIKAMFMGMIGKPLFDDEKNMIHDGKYGLFPFVKYERAKKKSKNKDAETLETKAIQSVTKECIREMLLTHVIPTFYEKWPQQLPKDIIIQWDNARPH
ncbi:uncharacterized protein LOC110726148 [Chenopodium quinoa]|uniref:uncharacterized protein LOC110726148 n=1 Tax=Chenopodium quinoa TaxID=63459 RepID=UPI000B770207|nr:uncharacterized protein LOC110726148 [Chenopodium quinoa]